MTAGTGLERFAARFPDRFYDVGIAEGHATVMAAGMATRGAIPVFAVYSSFLQRSYDMLLHDVAIGGLHVVFAVDRAGLVPGDGETHQGLFDVAFLSSIPGMTVLCPASFAELRDMLRFAVEKVAGPVAVRFPRGGEGAYKDGGTGEAKFVRNGTDFTIVTYGVSVNTALEAARKLAGEGVSVEVLKLGCINPIDFDAIAGSVAKTGRLMVLEECAGRGSAGESIAASLARDKKCPETVMLLNTGDRFAPGGEIDDLRRLCGIDTDSVCERIREELRDGLGFRNSKFEIIRGETGLEDVDGCVTSILAMTGEFDERLTEPASVGPHS
jgi:1-deoxy-D-xylulose-5-phosphate synthase